MSWNYRIVKYPEGGYGLHEVYYREDGSAKAMSDHPAGFVGDSAAEVCDALLKARVDARKRPVFEPPAEWNK